MLTYEKSKVSNNLHTIFYSLFGLVTVMAFSALCRALFGCIHFEGKGTLNTNSTKNSNQKFML